MIVFINMKEVFPHGTTQTVIRCKPSDKLDVNRAAKKLAMKPAAFMRTVIVQAARRVLDDEKCCENTRRENRG